MKPYLFTDIDDTIIYTKRKTDFSREVVVGAYNIENEVSSYIYKDVKNLFENFHNIFKIIPTTARNISSYHRTIFFKEFKIEDVILNFSGTILNNGKVDAEWHSLQREKYKRIPKISEIDALVQHFFQKHLESFEMPVIKDIDGFYISIYNKKFRDLPEMSKRVKVVIEDFMKQNGLENLFYIYQNDASFGILPNFLNKKFAVEYILNRDKPSLVLSAGDNISDLDFMKLAHFSILPKGSSLENKL